MLHQHHHHRGHAEDDDETGAAVVDVEVEVKLGSSTRKSSNNCTEDSSFMKHLRGILDDPNQIQRHSNILRWMSNGTAVMLDISSSSIMKHQLFPKTKKPQKPPSRVDTEDRTVTDELFRLLSVTDVYALLQTFKRHGFHTVHRNTCHPTPNYSKNTADLYFIFQRHGFVAAAFAAAAPSFHPPTIAHEDNIARAALDEQELRQPLELEVDKVGKQHPTATATAIAVPAISTTTSSASSQRRYNKRKRSSLSSSPTPPACGPKFKARIEEPFASFVERHDYDPADSTTSVSQQLPAHDAQQSSIYSYNATPYYYQQQQQQQEQQQQYSQPQYSPPQQQQQQYYPQSQQYSQQQYSQHAYYQQHYQPPYNYYSTNTNDTLVSTSHPPWYTDSSQYYYQDAYQQQLQGWPLNPSPPPTQYQQNYSVPLHHHQQQQQLQHPQYPATTMVPTSSWGHPTLTQQNRRRRPSSAPTIVQLQQEPEHEQRRPQDPKQQQYHDPQRPQPPPLPSPLTASKSSSSSSSLRSSSLISFCSSQELHSLSFAPEEEGEHDIAIQHRRTATVARAPAVPTVSRSSFSSRRRISPIIMDTTTAFVAVPVPVDPQVCDNASSTTAAARTTTTSPVFSPVSAAAVATITNSGNGALSTIVTESCTGDDGIGTQKIYAPHQVYDEGEGVLDDNDDDASSYYTSLNDTSSNCDNGMSSSVVMTNKTSSRYYD